MAGVVVVVVGGGIEKDIRMVVEIEEDIRMA